MSNEKHDFLVTKEQLAELLCVALDNQRVEGIVLTEDEVAAARKELRKQYSIPSGV